MKNNKKIKTINSGFFNITENKKADIVEAYIMIKDIPFNINRNPIPKLNMRSQINFQELKQYLLSLKYSDIETYWNKPSNPKLISGKSIDDIEYFRIKKVPDEKIIRYGEPFLVDALGNDLSILKLTKKRYRLPSGRVVNAKFVTTVIDDCRSLFGTPLNGYWKIPGQFIKKI